MERLTLWQLRLFSGTSTRALQTGEGHGRMGGSAIAGAAIGYMIAPYDGLIYPSPLAIIQVTVPFQPQLVKVIQPSNSSFCR